MSRLLIALVALLHVCLAEFKWDKEQTFQNVQTIAITYEGLNILLGSGELKKLTLIKKIITIWPVSKKDVRWVTSVGHDISFSTWAITESNNQLHWWDRKKKWTHVTTTQYLYKHISAGNFGVWAVTTAGQLVRKEGEIFDPKSNWIPIELVKELKFEHISTGSTFAIAVLSFSTNQYFKFNKEDKFEIIQVPFQFKWIEVSPNDDTIAAVTTSGTVMVQLEGKIHWATFGGIQFYRCFPIVKDSVSAWTEEAIYNLKCDAIGAEPIGQDVDRNVTEEMKQKLRLPGKEVGQKYAAQMGNGNVIAEEKFRYPSEPNKKF